MEELEPDPGPHTKRKADSGFAERRKRQKTRSFTIIKIGLLKLRRDKKILVLLNECVSRCSRVLCEASLLANLHVTCLLNEGAPVSILNQTFFRQCISSFASLATASLCAKNNPSLYETVMHYKALLPADYKPVTRLPNMSRMLEYIPQTAEQNFAASTTETFCSRLARWFRVKIRRDQRRAAVRTSAVTNRAL